MISIISFKMFTSLSSHIDRKSVILIIVEIIISFFFLLFLKSPDSER